MTTATRTACRPPTTGSFFVHTWGVYRTNVAFYQVTRAYDTGAVDLTPIDSRLISALGEKRERVACKPNAFLPHRETLKRCQVLPHGSVLIDSHIGLRCSMGDVFLRASGS